MSDTSQPNISISALVGINFIWWSLCLFFTEINPFFSEKWILHLSNVSFKHCVKDLDDLKFSRGNNTVNLSISSLRDFSISISRFFPKIFQNPSVRMFWIPTLELTCITMGWVSLAKNEWVDAGVGLDEINFTNIILCASLSDIVLTSMWKYNLDIRQIKFSWTPSEDPALICNTPSTVLARLYHWGVLTFCIMWWLPSWFSIEQIFLSMDFVKLCIPAPKLDDTISILVSGLFFSQYPSSPTSSTMDNRLKNIPVSALYEIGMESNCWDEKPQSVR